MARLRLSLILVFSALGAAEDTIVTDRPGFMDSPDVLRKGLIQVEGGTTYEVSSGVRSLGLGAQLTRVGLTDRLELRLAHDGYMYSGSAGSGWTGSSVGAKIGLLKERRWAPALAILPVLSIPVGGHCCPTGAYDPNLKLSWSKSLAHKLGLGGNLNVSALRDEQGRLVQRAASIAVSRAFGDVTTFVEAYVYDRLERKGTHLSTFDAGITKPIGRNVQIDISAGHSFTSHRREWFVAVGISVRGSGLARIARR